MTYKYLFLTPLVRRVLGMFMARIIILLLRKNLPKWLDEGDFLEHATIYQYCYGTSRDWVMKKMAAGIDVLLEIDWQGAQQIRQLFPSAILIFILPPSLDTLRQRLQNRRQDQYSVID